MLRSSNQSWAEETSFEIDNDGSLSVKKTAFLDLIENTIADFDSAFFTNETPFTVNTVRVLEDVSFVRRELPWLDSLGFGSHDELCRQANLYCFKVDLQQSDQNKKCLSQWTAHSRPRSRWSAGRRAAAKCADVDACRHPLDSGPRAISVGRCSTTVSPLSTPITLSDQEQEIRVDMMMAFIPGTLNMCSQKSEDLVENLSLLLAHQHAPSQPSDQDDSSFNGEGRTRSRAKYNACHRWVGPTRRHIYSRRGEKGR